MRYLRLTSLAIPVSMLVVGVLGCSSKSPSTGSPGGGGTTGAAGSGGSTGAAGTTGAAGSGGTTGAAGNGGNGGGSAGTTGNGGTGVTDGGAPDGSAGGGDGGLGPLAGTATRPLLTADQAAGFTISNYLGTWDPTAGVTLPASPTITVAPGGTYTTVQAAITAGRAMTGVARVYIQVMAGTYRELVCVPAGGTPITLYGSTANAADTVIVYGNYAGIPNPNADAGPPVATNSCITLGTGTTIGTDASSTFVVAANGFQAKNLTISNDIDEATITGAGTQAIALENRGDQTIYENVRLLGNQDTFLTKAGNAAAVVHSYLKDCYIEGDVDFLCGRGTAVFDHCTLHYLTARQGTNGGTFIAPSTAAANPYGFLIINSTLTADTGSVKVALGRAWDEGVASGAYVAGTSPNGQAVIRDSMLGGGGGAVLPSNAAAPWNASTSTRAFSATGNRLYEYNNSVGP